MPSLLSRWSARRNGKASARVRTPTVLQMEAVECGAACLTMVLHYHGRQLPLEQVRVRCDVSRDGTNAGNIVKAARAYGLKAKGFSKSAAAVRAMQFPAIAHWNFNHFVVLEGFHRKRVYLNDPARGRYAVTIEEFEDSFTGVVLGFERPADFETSRQAHGVLSGLRARMNGSGSAIAFIVLGSLVLILPGIITPVFERVFIDEVLVQQFHDWVPPLLLCMALILALNTGLTALQQRHLLRLENKLAVGGSSCFFWHVLHLPMEFFTQRFAGEIGNRVRLNDRLAFLLSRELAGTLLGLFTATFFLILMASYDLVLTAITLAFALADLAALLLVTRWRRDRTRRLAMEHAKLVGTTASGLAGIDVLKATAGETEYFASWSGQLAKVLNAEQGLEVTTRALAVLPTLLSAMNTVAILGIGCLRVLDGHITLGMLVAFNYLAGSFLGPISRLINVGQLFQEAGNDLGRLDDVLRYPAVVPIEAAAPAAELRRGGATTTTGKLEGRVEFRAVTFGYARLSAPLLSEFTLEVPAGGRVALVGRSGSGKSTVARLLSGLYQPWSGQILVDGMPLQDVPRSVVTRSIALVDQDILLFEDTVERNLSLWDDSLPETHMVQAARDACIHDDVMARRGGYRSIIREGGSNLSGGQRQRIEIARALAQRPTLLILDEATSALDSASEKTVMDNLRRRGITCVIVAHRLSTIRDCDEIVVLEHGRVVERGNHEALLRAGGHYFDLIRST